MKACVYGLWHLGSVTAACLAKAGIDTVGLEHNADSVAKLNNGQAPLFEPGLDDLIASGLQKRKLSFTCDSAAAISNADLVWVTFDTPVDDEDMADVDYVNSRVEGLFRYLRDGTIVLISSQVPVGNTAKLESRFVAVANGRNVHFAYSPENLRLGTAIKVFTDPGRIVVGVRNAETRARLEPLLSLFCDRLIWVSIEAAEMVKHAVNAYLATCVTFINEIASVCEMVGADASEVERALRSEPRIGEKAYIRPGAAFAGGTLARDVVFLGELGKQKQLGLPLLTSIIPSNRQHSLWPLRQVRSRLGTLDGHIVAVLGLSYKPGTSTIRRSDAISLIRDLLVLGAKVHAYDPEVKTLPEEFAAVTLTPTAVEAAEGASCMVISTEWPAFRELRPDDLLKRLRRPLIVDINRFLDPAITTHPDIEFITFGKPA